MNSQRLFQAYSQSYVLWHITNLELLFFPRYCLNDIYIQMYWKLEHLVFHPK